MTKRTKPALERAARALCELAGNPPMAKMDGKPLWVSYLPEVRAVLTAIREPSEPMQEAGSDVQIPGNLWGSDDIWRAMVDAALSELP
jgi:hypothetical protein